MEFIEKFAIDGLILDLGGGPNSLNRKGVINLDVSNYSSVDIIGDARFIPLSANTFDAIICNSVLEHIADVDNVISESIRILKDDGYLFFCVPQVCNRHHTIDYYRWTLPGLEKLFDQCEIIDKGVVLGPAMYLTHLVRSIIIGSMGRNFLSNFVNFVIQWLLFPIRFLDRMGVGTTEFENAAHTIYVIAKKRTS